MISLFTTQFIFNKKYLKSEKESVNFKTFLFIFGETYMCTWQLVARRHICIRLLTCWSDIPLHINRFIFHLFRY